MVERVRVKRAGLWLAPVEDAIHGEAVVMRADGSELVFEHPPRELLAVFRQAALTDSLVEVDWEPGWHPVDGTPVALLWSARAVA